LEKHINEQKLKMKVKKLRLIFNTLKSLKKANTYSEDKLKILLEKNKKRILHYVIRYKAFC